DPLDRLTEVQYFPDFNAKGTYTLFQLVWIGDRLVGYWQTDQPGGVTSKRYVGTDETGRPIDMFSWPSSGDATRIWAVNPFAWGEMQIWPLGAGIFQPVLFAGQYIDDWTVVTLADGVTTHRPGLVWNGYRTYDPFTGGYLQLDPLAARTWSYYLYADNNPVSSDDPTGRATWDGGEWDGEGETIVIEGTSPEEDTIEPIWWGQDPFPTSPCVTVECLVPTPPGGGYGDDAHCSRH
ncbi:MAG: RHS repeat-associated core domain-containing protein, partial [Kofleriaceae bacterium]